MSDLIAFPTYNTLNTMDLRRVEWPEFQFLFTLARLNSDRIRESTSDFEFDPAGETFYWVTSDGMSGFAINYAGQDTGELIYVFSRCPGRGKKLVQASIVRGARRLDCFDGFLTDFYGSLGFTVHRREANWNPEGPDVVYMTLDR